MTWTPPRTLRHNTGQGGGEESRLLLSVLPSLIKGQANKREELSEKPRSTKGGNGKHANLASFLASADQQLMYLCVVILLFRDLTFPDRKGWEVSMTAHMVKEAIKFSLRDAQAVSKILSHVDEMAAMLSEFRSQLAAVANNNNAQSTQEGGVRGIHPWNSSCRPASGARDFSFVC